MLPAGHHEEAHRFGTKDRCDSNKAKLSSNHIRGHLHIEHLKLQ